MKNLKLDQSLYQFAYSVLVDLLIVQVILIDEKDLIVTSL